MNFIEQIIQEVGQKGVIVKRDDVPVQAYRNALDFSQEEELKNGW